jgi:transcriptional regulator with XRE-family HTH domain
MDTRGIDKTVLYREIGNLLKQERIKKDLTQEQLAKMVGLKRTSITNLEAGRQQVPVHAAYEICQALGTELDALLPSIDRVTRKPERPFVLGMDHVPEDVERLMEELHQKITTNIKEEDEKYADRN